MSGQWEVVGKKKSKDNPPVNIKKPENKKNNPTSPRVEEVLPMQQVKNLYNAGKNKENRKPQEKPNKTQQQENGTKKVQKKTEKSQEPSKPRPHKSIESALNSINIEEFKSVYENSKRLFPDGPLIWLKEVVLFLNQRLVVDVQDVTFSTKPESYPLSVVPASIRALIERSTKEAGKNNAQLFLDMSLTAMANDMGKNLPVLGHKLYIQHLALSNPQFVLTNLNKSITLRNSYQNRQAIGLSILWALGQAGIQDLSAGLKVFQEVMLPLIEMKSYSRYVVQYLIDLIKFHDKVNITIDQYLLILDVAYANYKNFPNDLRKDVQSMVSKLNSMLLSQSNDGYGKCHVLVEPLLKKVQSNNSNGYKEEICEVLAECLIKNTSTFGTWSKCYTKYLPQSAILLNYLDQKWNVICNKLNRTVFADLLSTYSVTNEELLSKKKKESGLLDAVNAIKRLNDKMAAKKRSGFPYKFCSYVLIVMVAGVIYYDIRQHGTWERSRTYTGLKQVGIVEYSNNALDRTHQGLHWLHLRIDEQFPDYYEKGYEFVQPYMQLTKELGLVSYNMYENIRNSAIDKYPAFIASIESYAPGLLEESQKAVNNAWSSSVLYFNRGVDYLKTEVFVGQLAPENVQNVVLKAINTTQQKATECYHWLYEKVQSTIK